MCDQTKKRKIVKLTLIGSLALNFFLLGMFLGPLIHQPPAFERQTFLRGKQDGMGRMLRHLTKDLDKAEAQQVYAIFQKEQADFTAQREKMRELMKQMNVIFKQPVIDQEALERLMTGMTAQTEKLHRGLERAFIRMAKELPYETRLKIAATLEKLEAQPPR
ncbi:MAG: periplasmic heavy metal sensor [Alphaproteobacteria bacterium]|nr:periplasmic heavy metal sensor [Alphaproteobacteria bacterium]